MTKAEFWHSLNAEQQQYIIEHKDINDIINVFNGTVVEQGPPGIIPFQVRRHDGS